MKIQLELYAGSALGDTSAGAVIIEEMKALQKKHEEDMEDLMKEMQEATIGNDEDLKAELAKDRQRLEQLMANAEEDKKKLARPRPPPRHGPPPAPLPPAVPPRKSPNRLQKPLPDIPQEHVQTWRSDNASPRLHTLHAPPRPVYHFQEEMDDDQIYADRIAETIYRVKDKFVGVIEHLRRSTHTP